MTRELSDDALALIRSGVAGEPRAAEERRTRVRRAVLARAAAGGVVTLMGSGAAKAAGKSLLHSALTSGGIGVGAGLILAGAAQVAFGGGGLERGTAGFQQGQVVERGEPPGRVDAAASARSRSVRDAAQPRAQEPPVKQSREVTRPDSTSAPLPLVPAKPTQGSPKNPSTEAQRLSLRDELDLLAEVQGALRDGQGARALQLIASYDQRFPHGELQNERLAAEVFVACRTGDKLRARQVAERFLRRDNASALASRVRHACADQALDQKP